MTIAAFAILFGLDYIATVPPTVALVADRFGQHNVGVVYGWVFAAHMVGAADRGVGRRASSARTSATTRRRSWPPAGSRSWPASPPWRSGARVRMPRSPFPCRRRHDEAQAAPDRSDDGRDHRRLRPADLPDPAAGAGAGRQGQAGHGACPVRAPGFEVVFPDDVATDAGEARCGRRARAQSEPEPEAGP